MLNLLFKSAAMIMLGIWLKPRWKGILFVFFAIISIWLAQSEYISYLVLIDDFTYAGWSYLAKWLSILITLMVYYFMIEVSIREGAETENPTPSKSESRDEEIMKDQIKENDGFDFLREKKNLKSRSERILDE